MLAVGNEHKVKRRRVWHGCGFENKAGRGGLFIELDAVYCVYGY